MWKLRKGLQFALRDSNRVEVTTIPPTRGKKRNFHQTRPSCSPWYHETLPSHENSGKLAPLVNRIARVLPQEQSSKLCSSSTFFWNNYIPSSWKNCPVSKNLFLFLEESHKIILQKKKEWLREEGSSKRIAFFFWRKKEKMQISSSRLL